MPSLFLAPRSGPFIVARVILVLLVYSGEVPELDALLRRRLSGQRELVVVPYSLDDVASARDAAAYFHAVSAVGARVLPTRTYERAAALRTAVLEAGAVYLVGGNTYEFLAYARRVGLFSILQSLEQQDGIIAAESAGSILLSPDIATAAIPSRNRDVNTPRLARFAGMGRLPFHVSPHFHPRSRHAHDDIEELQSLADRSSRPVMVLEDGQGFVMRGSQIVRRVGRLRTLRPVRPSADLTRVPTNGAVYAKRAARSNLSRIT